MIAAGEEQNRTPPVREPVTRILSVAIAAIFLTTSFSALPPCPDRVTLESIEETTMSTTEDRSRRDFLRQAGAVGAALGVAGSALGAAKSSSGKTSARVLGANDRINVGVIGVGG